jgi:hypothetical protein
MYLGSWKIDDYVPIPVACHRFTTGAAYAPTVLNYSIYEDGGTAPLIENEDMVPASPFDAIVGLYLARPQLTAAAGFEKGKNYTVVIAATVDGVAALETHTFQIEAEVDSNTNSGLVTPAADSITASVFDESTAFPLKKADAGTTEVAREDWVTTALAGIPGTGYGDVAKTYTVRDQDGNVLPNCKVWATTDLAGATIIAQNVSNDLGQVTFMLTSGVTYYIWRKLPPYEFDNPDVEVA